jgi:ketosteroid isomerase-like protein
MAHHGLTLLTLAVALTPAAAQSAQRSRILALENAWNQAVSQKDVRAVDSLMAADMVDIEYDGTLTNKAQYLASVQAPDLRFEHVASDSMQVQFYGRSAIVIGVYSEKGIKNGKPFLHRERFVDTWINKNGTWLCVASQSTLIAH